MPNVGEMPQNLETTPSRQIPPSGARGLLAESRPTETSRSLRLDVSLRFALLRRLHRDPMLKPSEQSLLFLLLLEALDERGEATLDDTTLAHALRTTPDGLARRRRRLVARGLITTTAVGHDFGDMPSMPGKDGCRRRRWQLDPDHGLHAPVAEHPGSGAGERVMRY